MNQSEKYISFLCNKTFLSLWSFPSPKGKKGKELCDVLIVFEKYIIIISVKAFKKKQTSDYETDVSRWLKSVFTKSNNQLLGAERFLKTVDDVIINKGGEKIELSPKKEREYFKMTIALGRGQDMPLFFGDSGKGFIHVFDEISVKNIFFELDTITDFIKYLNKKESFLEKTKVVFSGEEDLLAVYLMNGNQLHSKKGKIIIESGVWEDYQKSDLYKTEKDKIKNSYIWDLIIENFSDSLFKGTLIKNVSREDLELALRHLAKEDRIHRNELAKMLIDLIKKFKKKETNSRIVKASDSNGIAYVFLISPQLFSREYRYAELTNRCFIARSKLVECETIIGIATEESIITKSFSLDLVYLHMPVWTEQNEKVANDMIEDLGYFRNI